MTAVPVVEPSVAVMVAAPVALAVARPWDPEVLEIVAVDVDDDDHVTVLVRSAVDRSEYVPVAVYCWVSPTGTFCAAGETVIDTSTAGRTVITEVPVMDPSVAVMVAAPLPLAVARPCDPDVLEIVAVDVDDDDHVTVLVRSAVDRSEYVPVAVYCWVSPTGTFCAAGDTAMDTSAAGITVMTAVPVVEPSVAVMVAAPVALAVARPCDPDVLEIVAVDVDDDDHVTMLVRPTVDRSEYVPVAVYCWVSPMGTFCSAGDTAIDTSTAGTTVMTAVPRMRPLVAGDGGGPRGDGGRLALAPDVLETVPVPVSDDDHVTELVMSAVERSE